MKTVYVTELTSSDYEEKTSGKGIVLVDIWAPWCGPCKILSPIIDEVASDFGPKVLVGKMNADDNMDLCGTLGIRSIPTLIFYKDGKIREKRVGAVSKTDITKVIDDLLSESENEDHSF